MSSVESNCRKERDSMGSMDVPSSAYYGASTMRAVMNFPISNLRFSRTYIRSLALIKGAASQVNVELGLLGKVIGDAVSVAAAEVARGELDRDFVIDIFQTGSGTSTNMNANEVIANRAGELLGAARGKGKIHPNDHVNMCQSSNDVIPTAIHLAALIDIEERLIPSLKMLERSLMGKSENFWSIVKTGRTHLQDATPVRLGQEFYGYGGQISRAIKRLGYAQLELNEVALGGTAVGTGINAHPEFAKRVCALISENTGIKIQETTNHFQAQNTIDAIVATSGILRTVAISLYKIANDIRWLGSGPRAGIGELALPEVQPGSSIMPGKVNPVIPESVIQVVGQVIGNDTAICNAGYGSLFELNMMLPIAAHNLLESINLLATASTNFSEQCIVGLTATENGPLMVERGLMLGTALAPAVGYDKAAGIAKKAAETGSTIRAIAEAETSLSSSELDRILNPEKMTEPGLGSGTGGG